MPIHRCQSFKTDQTPCTRNASRNAGDTHPDHLHLCTQHKGTYQRNVEQTDGLHHTPGRCYHLSVEFVARRRAFIWCPNAANEEGTLCIIHELQRRGVVQRHEQRRNERTVIAALVEDMVEEEPPVPWRQAARVLAEMDGIPFGIRRAAAEEYYRLPRTQELEPAPAGVNRVWRFRVYWNWAITGQVGPEPDVNVIPVMHPPVAGLAAIARDNQNVHTRVVSEQTNTATTKLLAVKVPETQQTEKTLTLVWLGGLRVSYGTYLRVANDIDRWFNTKDCRTVDDNLYRRLLRGLVAMIGMEKDAERRSELYRRAWEECHESVGMCCEGHISRLCNVLVGFDEDFQPPVPFGEILQSKMAVIAGMDVSDEEKRKLANAFFDEHKTPQEERTAWLEAF